MPAVGLGADAIVATAPFYAQVTEPPEVERHFRSLKAACGAPLLAYDIPVAVHSKLSKAQLLALAGDRIIDGLKDSSGDIAGMREVIIGARTNREFAVSPGRRRSSTAPCRSGLAAPYRASATWTRGVSWSCTSPAGPETGIKPGPTGTSHHCVRYSRGAPGQARVGVRQD